MKKGTALIVVTILSIFLVLTLIIVSAQGGPPPYTIEGNKVFVNDSKAYISAEPHTLYYNPFDNWKKPQWINFTVQSKVYTGDVDIVFGFDTESLIPKRIQRYNPVNLSRERSFTCETNYFNYTLITPKHAWCYRNVTTNNVTNETELQLLFERDFESGNLSSKTITWTEYKMKYWHDFSSNMNSINYDYQDMNKWYYAKNLSIVANQIYKIRVDMEVQTNKEYNKYWFAIKPSGETIQEAITNNHFYALDPWINSSGDNQNKNYLSDKLLAYWDFNDSASTLVDIYSGTYNGTVSNADLNATGIIGEGLTFDGATSGVVFSDSVFDSLTSVTISVWLKPQRICTSGYGYFFQSENQQHWNLGRELTCDLLVNFGSEHIWNPLAPLEDKWVTEQWLHIVVTSTTGNTTIYFNGVYNKSDTNAWTTTTDTAMYMGYWGVGAARYYKGMMDEVGVWNRTLNSTEVADLYNSGAGISYTNISDVPVTPKVDITYPGNFTYYNNVSELNYTVTDGSRCWYSNSSGATNSSDVAAGIDFTNVVPSAGSNTWTVYCNSTDSNINSTDVQWTWDYSPFLVTNTGVATYVRANNTSINVEVTGQHGIREIYVYLNDSNYTGSFFMNFSNQIDGGNISMSVAVINTSYSLAKSIIHNTTSIDRILNRSLFIPTTNNVGEVYICPSASTFTEINASCPGKVTLAVNETENGMTMTNVSVNGTYYYKVINITGTGGGEGSAPTLTNGNVTPSTGGGATVFYYNVTYTDAENDTAQFVYVNINGTNYTMTEFNSTDQNVTDGKVYNYSRTMSDGTHNFSFWAEDEANISVNTTTYTGPIVDMSAPKLNITTPVNTTYNVETIALVWNYTETNPDTAYASINGGANASLNITDLTVDNVTGQEGHNTLIIWMNDSVGNGNSTSREFTVDTKAPQINLTYPRNITYTSNVTELNWTYFDNSTPSTCWYTYNASCGFNDSDYAAGFIDTLGTATNPTNAYDENFGTYAAVSSASGATKITNFYENWTLPPNMSRNITWTTKTMTKPCNVGCGASVRSRILGYCYNWSSSSFLEILNIDKQSSTPEELRSNGTALPYDCIADNDIPAVITRLQLYALSSNAQISETRYYESGLNATCGSNVSCTANFTSGIVSQEGKNEVCLYANDTYGQLNLSYIQYTVDSSRLLLTINTPQNTSYNSSNLIFNVTGSKAISYCNFNLSGGSNYTMTNLTSTEYNYTNTSMSDGQYTAVFWCNESMGLVNDTETVTFIIDTSLPELNYTSPTPSSGTNQSSNSIYVNTTWNDTNPDTLLFRLHNNTGEYNVTFYSANGNSNITISTADTITNNTHVTNFANAYDNDWTTYAEIDLLGGNIIENYTIGADYDNVTWIVKVEGRLFGCVDIAEAKAYNFTSNVYDYIATLSTASSVDYINLASDYISVTNQVSVMANYSNTSCISDNIWYYESSMKYNTTAYGNISQNFTNFTDLPDGIYYFNVTLNDTTGNSNTTDTRTIVIDTLNPNVSLVSPANNTNMTNQSANFTALMNDSGGLKNATLYIYNSTGDLYNSTVISFVAGTTTKTLGIVVGLIDGVYTWFYNVFDWLGQSTSTGNFTLTIDNTTPQINYSTGTNINYANLSQSSIFVNTTWNETNPSAILFRLHNTTGEVNVTSYTPTAGTTDINWTGLPDEIYTYNVTLNDTAGSNTTTLTKTITLDNANPLMNISSPINISYGTNTTNFTLNINDTSPITLCKFTLNNWVTNYTMDISQGSGTAIANYTNSSMTDGHHTAEFWCNDSVNNINNTENVEFEIDSSSPVVNITFPSVQIGYHRNSTNITFNWTYIETTPDTCFLDYTGTNFSVNCTDNSSIYTPVNITDFSNRNITMWMNDTFGNTVSFQRNWTYKFFEINTSYESFSYEGDSQTYVLNMTTDNASRIDLAYLVYNDTSYLATKGGSGTNVNFTRSINVPMAGNNNKTLYWNVIYGDSDSNISINSTYTYNQSIVSINVVRCNSSVNFPYYNFTFNDEVTTSLELNASTNYVSFEYYLNNSAYNKTYTFFNLTENPSYGYCFTPPNRTLYVSSVEYEYSTLTPTNYPLRKWDNTSVTIPANYTINKTLWLLSAIDGAYITFTVSDTGGTALNGSEISITRIIDGNTVEVGSDVTGSDGTATFFLYQAASHTVDVSRINCTGATFSIVPTQTSYSITLNCLSGSTIGGNSNIEGVRYSRSPFVGGTTASGNVTFDYYAISLLYDIIKAKFELYYSNGTFITSNETYVPTAYCNATECYMRLTLNVSTGEDIKARYYLAVNNTDTGEEGYILLEGDAHWRFITTIASDVGTVKNVFTNLRDLFTSWRPVGKDPITGWDFTAVECSHNTEVTCNAVAACTWENSTTDVSTGTCFSLNQFNRLEYSRIVFIFLFIAIILTIFGRLTGYDAQNPGAFLILITGLIGLGTFANGITGPGFFYYNNLTPVPFLNNAMLFITVGFFTLGYYLSLTRRYT